MNAWSTPDFGAKAEVYFATRSVRHANAMVLPGALKDDEMDTNIWESKFLISRKRATYIHSPLHQCPWQQVRSINGKPRSCAAVWAQRVSRIKYIPQAQCCKAIKATQYHPIRIYRSLIREKHTQASPMSQWVARFTTKGRAITSFARSKQPKAMP
jgi:hypothetical protein